MIRMTFFALLFTATLSAQDFEFKPLKCTPSGGTTRNTSALVVWDKPEIAVKQLEVYIFAHNWPVMPTIDERVPDWRKRLFADEFDAAAWQKAGGPQCERVRVAVDEKRAPMGVIDQREEYRMVNVAVLFIDADGKRHVPANMKASVEEVNHVRNDVYYLPSYMPNFWPGRLFAKEPVTLKWKLPDIGGGPYEIEKVRFIGMEVSMNTLHISRLEGGFEAWLAGKDKDSKPMAQELAKDATACWIKDLNFKYYVVVATTKGGLHFTCKIQTQGANYEAKATEEDQKNLPAIELKAREAAKEPEKAPEKEPEKS